MGLGGWLKWWDLGGAKIVGLGRERARVVGREGDDLE